MAFLNPVFLLGAMAASIPVLVHLVRRTRARRIEFPSLMFLRRIEQKTIRKRKLRNLLLLAMRCAALMLLALAFARPYFTGTNAQASDSGKSSSVILLDGSYSTRFADTFNRARLAARDIVNRAAADERLALIQFGQGYSILMPLKADRAQASALLDSAAPTLEATDYLQAIQAADSVLKDAGGERRIYLISDFQESGWNRDAPPIKLRPGVQLIPVDVSESKPENLAVASVQAEPIIYAQKYAGKVVARVTNFGSNDARDVAVDFKLNDLTVERRPINLGPGASETIEFSGFNVPEGSNRATVEIAGDQFPLDDKYFFTLTRDNQSKVLAIETASRGRSESFFLQQALLAGENNRHALTIKTAGSVNPAELDSYQVVIVNDVADISDALATALKAFAERGGGLILAAGKHAEATGFNRAFAAIAPAELGEIVQTRGSYALMSQVKMDHPIFSAFAKGGRLASTRVYAYHRATAKEGTSVIAALDDGSPLIIEGTAGSGKVLLVTTTLDTAWNDLPLTPMYLPLVRQTLEYLGGRETASSYIIGQMFAASPDAEGALPLVENPAGGRIEDARRTATGELSIPASEQGFYRLRYRTTVENVAVNLDTKESDLAKLSVDEFIASVTPGPGNQNGQPFQGERLSAEEIESRQRLWLPLLIAALALFLAEALMARRIRIAKLIG